MWYWARRCAPNFLSSDMISYHLNLNQLQKGITSIKLLLLLLYELYMINPIVIQVLILNFILIVALLTSYSKLFQKLWNQIGGWVSQIMKVGKVQGFELCTLRSSMWLWLRRRRRYYKAIFP